MRSFKAFLQRNRGFIVFLLCMFMFRSAVADWNVVPSGSMLPTIRIGDRIFVNRAAYDLRVPFTHLSLYHVADPQRGDIVIADSSAAGERLVKRVIGVPGDVVALRQNVLWVNGQRASYQPAMVAGVAADRDNPASYASEDLGRLHHLVRLSRWPGPVSSFGPVAVPAGRYLLMGDNRDDSMDSRYFGFVPRDEIVGRTRYVAISLDPARHYLPRSGRFGASLD
ncbi:signal peptidase I [Rhodanobacter sp. PCA2]|uniref:signal peptidase I n=1 Tax=Rhodanobacter sp. PCA2 TaxID=2006117 RepID=UPI0015E7A826|nr:signal peptidase I [Rhodanobacter sp. PCA2]MBA2077578.1 signal peptidase I [Rhodanobacter sp. PCA2]